MCRWFAKWLVCFIFISVVDSPVALGASHCKWAVRKVTDRKFGDLLRSFLKKSTLHDISMGEIVEIAAPDGGTTDGIGDCVGIVVVNKVTKKAWAGHSNGASQGFAKEMITTACKESRVEDLQVVVFGMVPLFIDEYAVDLTRNHTVNNRKDVDDELADAGIKPTQIEKYLASDLEDVFGFFVDAKKKKIYYVKDTVPLP